MSFVDVVSVPELQQELNKHLYLDVQEERGLEKLSSLSCRSHSCISGMEQGVAVKLIEERMMGYRRRSISGCFRAGRT